MLLVFTEASEEEGQVKQRAGSEAHLARPSAGSSARGAAIHSNGAPYLTRALSSLHATLSPKEQAVALAAARGSEDKEIASELACTLSTVRTLWQRIYKKTHTTSKRRLISAIWDEACKHCLSEPLSFIERHDGFVGLRGAPVRQGLEEQTLLED